jgi:hypothetical protein
MQAVGEMAGEREEEMAGQGKRERDGVRGILTSRLINQPSPRHLLCWSPAQREDEWVWSAEVLSGAQGLS